MSTQSFFDDNINLAYSYVHKNGIIIPGHEKEDIIQLALIGLWKACSSFNPNKNIKFSTYATNCIRNEVLMALRKETGKTKIINPISLNDFCDEIENAYSNYDNFIEGKCQTEEEVLAELIDLASMDFSNQEKLLLSTREFLSDVELSDLCGITKSSLRHIRKKGRSLR